MTSPWQPEGIVQNWLAGECDHRALDHARVIQVIVTTLTRRGEGKSLADPMRVITQYWSMDGELLAEVDPWLKAQP